MSGIEKMATFVVARWRRIVEFVVGRGLWFAVCWTYDNILYVAAIAKFGAVAGGIAMTIGSVGICFGMLVHYRNKKVNWLGWDVARKALASKINIESKTFKIFGDAIAFIMLSVLEDPFVTTAYMRHGKENGISKKDIVVLIGSVLLGNLYWVLRTVAIVEVAKYLWHLMF